MTEIRDPAFDFDAAALADAIARLNSPATAVATTLPDAIPKGGFGEAAALGLLAPFVIGGAARLGAPDTLAHMDPPTPWITWATTLWNAALNQNVLHPATAPFAREAERCAVGWLSQAFGMNGGWMASGATVANLTAIWAARDAAGATRVVASADAHVSVEKAARILGLPFVRSPVTADRRIDPRRLPDLSDACLVLTAGTTATGAIDDLTLGEGARWRHVDAAWAGPLRFASSYAGRLECISSADSVAISAHKLLFQPKGAALILFKESAQVEDVLGFGGGYLAAPNLGVEGSRGAGAIPLLATLLAWGRSGLADRVNRCMKLASELEQMIEADSRFTLFGPSDSGVVVFRPQRAGDHLTGDAGFSRARIDGLDWLRCACANPLADLTQVAARLEQAQSLFCS